MGVSAQRILYCDESIVVVNKRSGELVVGGSGTSTTLPLLDFLRKDFPGIRSVHRLDFETSGVVLFARSREVLQAVLSTKFDQWKKVYHTLVKGLPPRRGVIRVPLPVRSGRGQVPAQTQYRVLEPLGIASLMEATIHAGQYHQIRRHFAAVKHPLVLDTVYGDRLYNRSFALRFGFHRFFLHASSLTLPHPVTGDILHVEAPLPRLFDECLKRLRGGG